MTPSPHPLSDDERQRYARQLDLPGFGPNAQEKLRASSVAVIGCGSLAAPALLYLAAAGIGRLSFCDSHLVATPNLLHQPLHTTHDIGRNKTDSATEHLRALNPHVQLNPSPLPLTPKNAAPFLQNHSLAIDTSNHTPTQYLVNDTCCALRIPFIHAALSAWNGRLLPVIPGQTPCLRCVFPLPPPAENTPSQGPLAPLPGIIGTLIALEAIRILTSLPPPPDGTLLSFDARASRLLPLHTARRPHCPACAPIPPET